jgi:hypothetical protein
MAYRCNMLPSMYSASQASTSGSKDGDVHLQLLQAIFKQNSDILAQNRDIHACLSVVEKNQTLDIHARLAAVEKEVEQSKVPQRSHVRPRPRSKAADGFLWKCPVCSQPLKHLDSFLSHIRKLAILTVHRAARVHQARCHLDLTNQQHLLLVVKFTGDSNATKAASFASHLLNVCRSISASGTVVEDKHARIFEWLHRVIADPTFSVAGECPSVSDTPSSGAGARSGCSSGSSDMCSLRLVARHGGL